MRAALHRHSTTLLLALAASCAPGGVPELAGVLELTEARVAPTRGSWRDDLVLDYDHAAGELVIEQRVDRGSWQLSGDGSWRVALAVPALPHRSTRRIDVELMAGSTRFDFENTERKAQAGVAQGRTDLFVANGETLAVYPATGRPPGDAVYREARRLRDAAGTVWRDGETADGFAVPSGHTLEIVVPPGPAGTVRFGLRGDAVGWTLPSSALSEGEGPARRVEHRLGASARTRTLELTFAGNEVSGLVTEPLFVPADLETSAPAPDLVVFLADTFRADNLAAYRGLPGGVDLELTPFLDGWIAERCAWFPDAWSTASWTLPAHASLFTGLYPPEHTAETPRSRLPGELPVLAERLRAAGYRTSAHTDGGYVVPAFGLERGFASFTVGETDLSRTRAALLRDLERTDPRPRFVFVQTYRTHQPYGASAAILDELRPHLAVPEEDGAELRRRLHRDPEGRRDQRLASPRDVVEALAVLYRAGARELDRELEGLWRDLDAMGFAERGVFVFTSDHGDALGERGLLGHGLDLDETEARIPLAFCGAGIAPGRRDRPASLLDLGTTLLALAGAQPALGRGRDLLAADVTDEPLHAFQADADRATIAHATWHLGVKWWRRVDDDAVQRFDLPVDPNRTAGDAVDEFPYAERLAELSRAQAVPAAIATVDDAARERLRALGYATDE